MEMTMTIQGSVSIIQEIGNTIEKVSSPGILNNTANEWWKVK
ncbi:hypothetical protein [Peribacillus sp. NPDC058076]